MPHPSEEMAEMPFVDGSGTRLLADTEANSFSNIGASSTLRGELGGTAVEIQKICLPGFESGTVLSILAVSSVKTRNSVANLELNETGRTLAHQFMVQNMELFSQAK